MTVYTECSACRQCGEVVGIFKRRPLFRCGRSPIEAAKLVRSTDICSLFEPKAEQHPDTGMAQRIRDLGPIRPLGTFPPALKVTL
jgi:hypothetical protein